MSQYKIEVTTENYLLIEGLKNYLLLQPITIGYNYKILFSEQVNNKPQVLNESNQVEFDWDSLQQLRSNSEY